MIVLIPYISLLYLSWIIKRLFLRTRETLTHAGLWKRSCFYLLKTFQTKGMTTGEKIFNVYQYMRIVAIIGN